VPGRPQAKVKLPGSNTFVPLDQLRSLPKGTIVDVTGAAAISLSDPSGNRAVFTGLIAGGPSDGVPSDFAFQGVKKGFVQLALTGGNFRSSSSAHRKLSVLEAAKKPVRRLWGSGKGKFTTKGKYAAATVRGTIWLVADYTDHSLVTVKRGLVAVQNLVTKKTTLVPAGHSIIVNAKPPKKPAKKHTTTKPKKPAKKK
jgi:hypothetical protein